MAWEPTWKLDRAEAHGLVHGALRILAHRDVKQIAFADIVTTAHGESSQSTSAEEPFDGDTQ